MPSVLSCKAAIAAKGEGATMTDMAKDENEIETATREDADTKRKSDGQDRALTPEEKLDEGLKDSMDASDPPSSTRPDDHGEPVPSSSYQEEE